MKPNSIYASPLRVYILLAILACGGIGAGLSLPISLFPNSAKPVVNANVNYGSSTADEFERSYGEDLEILLRGITTVKVENVKTTYDPWGASYEVNFAWNQDPLAALREVERIVTTWSAVLPKEIRESTGTWLQNENGGFIAISFYSDSRSLDEVYDILNAAIGSKISTVSDADSPELWNPARKEIRIELKPETLAALQIFPSDVEAGVQQALATYNGGSILNGLGKIRIQSPRTVAEFSDLGSIPIVSRSGRVVHLSDIATIDFGLQSTSSRIIKTSGSKSIVLFATPKAGGNVKSMAEDLKKIVADAMPALPKDLHYRTLVDPSEFIRSAINNVFHEVGIGSLLAVSVLFIFMGAFRNVATAAIEIPLSLILAFILMKFSGVNINIISLGGLALSAGMNVDASVVVMENIFRHFDPYKGKSLSFAEKLAIVQTAVKEVRSAIISSTVASLVVFVPLLVTSGLSHAILGDLAKAVVFSHGFSAVIALILVPTVRLHIMGRSKTIVAEDSLFESKLERLESAYARTLGLFINRKSFKWYLGGGLILLIVGLTYLVIPKLPREIIGIPDSDMMMLDYRTQGNSKIRQMETSSDQIEKDLLSQFGDRIDYTFTQVSNPNRGFILAKLRNKKDMTELWHEVEKKFVNTPELKFRINPWNPSELPIPHPPEFRLTLSGGDLSVRRDTALDLKDLLESKAIFDRVGTEPDVERTKVIKATPDLNQWSKLNQGPGRISIGDVMDLSRVATEGRRIGSMPMGDLDTRIFMRFPDSAVASFEDILSLPVGALQKIVPLKSLLKMTMEEAPPSAYRVDGQEMFAINGRLNESEKHKADQSRIDAAKVINDWIAKKSAEPADGSQKSAPTVQIEDAGKDVTDAIKQLSFAVAASVILIFVVLLIQFGSIAESMLVLVAVPLGFIGVVTSLFIFKSSLSLNSVLGVILLNGIAVNNSIILVDFIRRLHAEGLSPFESAIKAAKLRLRPILITSLTTVLGMTPIALGFGEGGRILQPLGIAVAGGLWISMILTLFLVPALQVSYLERRHNA
ncbi:MAG: efflux RND transporter permease subunit [Proteobacteria bacterium]|nr:efflux RND transporter permease subunit [Pseudomonadota bacterium]